VLFPVPRLSSIRPVPNGLNGPVPRRAADRTVCTDSRPGRTGHGAGGRHRLERESQSCGSRIRSTRPALPSCGSSSGSSSCHYAAAPRRPRRNAPPLPPPRAAQISPPAIVELSGGSSVLLRWQGAARAPRCPALPSPRAIFARPSHPRPSHGDLRTRDLRTRDLRTRDFRTGIPVQALAASDRRPDARRSASGPLEPGRNPQGTAWISPLRTERMIEFGHRAYTRGL
jgi:hypothetical protein